MAMEPKELMEDWIRTFEMEKSSALHSGRQSDPYHLDQFILMNMELIQIELKASCLMNQAAQHQQCGNALGYNGGCCNARKHPYGSR